MASNININQSLTENGINNNNEQCKQDEIIHLEGSDGSDIEIIAVSKSVAEGRTKQKLRNFIRNRRTKIYVNSVNSRNQDSYIKEEIIISDLSDSDNDGLNKLTIRRRTDNCNFKALQNTPKRKFPDPNESLSSIILNCPRCNKTETVFSTTIGKITCKECNVNMFYVCDMCNLRYQTMPALYRHKKLQCKTVVKEELILKPKRMFILKCSKCSLVQSVKLMKRLAKCLTCKIDMPYECVVCSKTYNSYSNLYIHAKLRCQPSTKTYYCNECNYSCTNELTLERHLNKSHVQLYVQPELNCCKCDQKFNDNTRLRTHEINCGIPYYKCQFCTYKPKFQENLRKHLRLRHRDLLKGADLERILKEAASQKKEFKNKEIARVKDDEEEAVEDFNSIVDLLKKVYCVTCDKRTPYYKGFRSCPVCGTGFRYECSGCTSLFRGMPSLYRHIRRQHGRMSHVCSNCGRSFSFYGDANEHRKSCGKAPRFECEICYFKTRYKYNLRCHMDKIHNENRQDFSCEDCGVRYKLAKSMKKHLERCVKRKQRVIDNPDRVR